MIDPRRGLLVASALACLITVPSVAQSNATNVSISEARRIAEQAVRNGNPKLALEIANGLLQANSKDADTLLLISRAQAQLSNHRRGHKAARLAYRHAQVPAQKLDASVWAARHALRDERPTLTQVWLRRASLHAATEADRDKIAKDYRAVRARNPLSFRLDFGLRPSNNINNGADESALIVDGVDTTGRLRGAAQALSGVVGHVDARVGYRLREDARSRTTVNARVRVQRVRLSSNARETLSLINPSLSSPLSESDFGSTYAELSLAHTFAIGDTKSGNSAHVAAAFGGLWSGDEFYARHSRIEADRTWRLTADSAVSLSGSVSLRDRDNASSEDNVAYGLYATYIKKRENGDRLTFGVGITDSQSDSDNQKYKSVRVRTAYSFGRQVGPAKIATALEYGTTSFDTYGLLLPNPDGTGFVTRFGPRDDRAVSASLNMVFEDYDYAGFAPEVTIRASRRTSNISRFDSTQLSVSFGIQSKF